MRSPTDAQSATKPSTGAVPSTPTYGSTPGTNHTPAKCAEKDSTKKVRHVSEILRAYSKRCTDKRATDKKAKKADKRAENQSYILSFFQCNKTDVELDLFEDVSTLLRTPQHETIFCS